MSTGLRSALNRFWTFGWAVMFLIEEFYQSNKTDYDITCDLTIFTVSIVYINFLPKKKSGKSGWQLNVLMSYITVIIVLMFLSRLDTRNSIYVALKTVMEVAELYWERSGVQDILLSSLWNLYYYKLGVLSFSSRHSLWFSFQYVIGAK